MVRRKTIPEQTIKREIKKHIKNTQIDKKALHEIRIEINNYLKDLCQLILFHHNRENQQRKKQGLPPKRRITRRTIKNIIYQIDNTIEYKQQGGESKKPQISKNTSFYEVMYQ